MDTTAVEIIHPDPACAGEHTCDRCGYIADVHMITTPFGGEPGFYCDDCIYDALVATEE